MHRLSSEEMRALREGLPLSGHQWALFSKRPFPKDALILCGSDAQVEQLGITLPEAVLQLIDTEESLIYAFEQEPNDWLYAIIDVADGPGSWAMQVRRPIAAVRIGSASPSDGPDKALPLQPDSETALETALASYKKRFRCYRNGSFKIEPNDA